MCISFSNLLGQDLANSRKSSPYTYIYKLTDSEARQMYEKTISAVDDSFFHTRIDSFSTDSIYSGVLSYGHYLYVFADGNQINVELESINNVDIRMLNNQQDLQIIAFDSIGARIEDAALFVGKKKVKFNERSQTYLVTKSNHHGLGRIFFNGHWSYFKLKRQYNHTFLARAGRTIKYAPPIKYLWMPFRDIYRSIRHGYRAGFVDKIAGWFDPYYRDDKDHSRKFGGYIAFNKPVYRPGDTVKLKAFVIRKNRKPINRDLLLRVGNYSNKYKTIAHLKPVRRGVYTHEFVLDDSLDFQIDRTQQVLLQKKDKTIIQSRFKLEDYELKSTKYTLRSDEKKSQIGHPMILYMKGVDENEMNLLDARVEFTITSKPLVDFAEKQIFIPDTLWVYKQNLDPLGETKVVLPDSIFPAVNLRYKVKAHFLNSNNELQTKHLDLSYVHSKETFKFVLKNDSLYIDYLKSGQPTAHKAVLSADSGEEELFEKEITLPYRQAIDPYISDYYVSDDNTDKNFWVKDEDDGVSPLTYRTKDSVFIELNNKRKLPIWYAIYAGKHEIEKGYSNNETISFKRKSKTAKPYFISFQYLWANKIKEREQSIAYFDKQLKITIDQPEVISPGETAQLSINVVDHLGEPVQNVDLTAFAYTKKFEPRDSAPEVPYMGKLFNGRSTYNSFRKENIQLSTYSKVALKKWRKELGLDSVEYYKFLFPDKKMYRHNTLTPDSSTQFAPFVLENGNIKRIHVIYVNNVPVYYSGVSAISNYSFRVDPNRKHTITLRMADQTIKIDSIHFKEGHKNIFSFSNLYTKPWVHVSESPRFLTMQEKRKLRSYFITVTNNFNNKYAYLKQHDKVQLLSQQTGHWNRRSQIIAGPFYSNSIKYQLIDDFSTNFIYEPSYDYQFHEGLLKMKFRDNFSQFDRFLNDDDGIGELRNFALTEQNIQEKWEAYLANKNKNQTKYRNPSYSRAGNSKLHYLYSDSLRQSDVAIQNMILLNEDNPNFIRIYPRNKHLIYDLKPGSYSMIFLLSTNEYFKIDSIDIGASGTKYITINMPQIFTNDTFIEEILEIVSQHQLQSNFIKGELDRDLRRVKQLAIQKYQNRSLFDHEVTGRITAVEDGSGIPGVNVVIKGTTTGTISDIDGNYTIYVPSGGVLVYSFIGYATEEVDIGNRSTMDLAMGADVKQLSEVVVTAMGVSRSKKSLGYSVTTINALQGKVAGVSVIRTPRFRHGGAGASSEIKVRGNSSIIGNNKPLIILNGVPYEGGQSDIDPASIRSINILKGEAGIALYGARAAGGVIVITSSNLNPNRTTELFQADSRESQNTSHSLRSNFSDYAYWKPDLVSDHEGNASFSVKFPDDVTNWKTFVFGMDNKKHSGQMESSIKSFKSVMTNLAVPRFITNQDTVNVIGKILNYTRDTLDVKAEFIINDTVISSTAQKVYNSLIDSVKLFASHTDSIKISYSMEQSSGYFDGEERTVPVYKVGTNKTKGHFYLLDQDTTLSLSFDPNLGEVSLFANANTLDILESEIDHVSIYPYMCNEQMASKLHTLLADKKIKAFRNKKFKNDQQIKSLIRKLQKHQKANGLWGWWSNSSSEFWISNHILNALYEAKNQGFSINIETDVLVEDLKWNLDNMNVHEKIIALSTLKKLESNIEFKGHVDLLEKRIKSLNDYLKLLNLKSELGFEIQLDSLLSLKKETILGNIYWESNEHLIYDNSFENTILAYQLLDKVDSLKAEKSRTRAYLLGKRSNGYWRNTFESSRVINAILPSSLVDSTVVKEASITLNNKEITEFPYEQTLNDTYALNLTKTGSMPVYFTAHQKRWVNNPLPVADDIKVKTYFKDDKDILKTGIPTKLFVEVTMLKKAEYLMIEIPIPAGCYYQNKSVNYAKEEHREYYKNKTNIYIKSLPAGTHVFEIDLVPRYSGSYALNPAKVELMYYPTIYGRNGVKRVKME